MHDEQYDEVRVLDTFPTFVILQASSKKVTSFLYYRKFNHFVKLSYLCYGVHKVVLLDLTADHTAPVHGPARCLGPADVGDKVASLEVNHWGCNLPMTRFVRRSDGWLVSW